MISTIIILSLWLLFLFLIFVLPKILGWVVLSNLWRIRKVGGVDEDTKRELLAAAEKSPEALAEALNSLPEPMDGVGGAGEPSFFSWDYVWIRVPEDFNPREYGIEFFVEGDGFVNKSEDVEVRLVEDIRGWKIGPFLAQKVTDRSRYGRL